MYARIRNKSTGRIPEDEVTSCVLGPLRMMGAMEPARTWEACLHLFQWGHLFPKDFEPTDVSVKFWPQFPTQQRGSVEPHVHVIARRGAEVRTIPVEVKCGAALGDDQLLRQWAAIQLSAEGSNPVLEGDELRRGSVHVLLGYVRPRHRSDIDAQEARASAAGITWEDRLITITWGQFALQLQTLAVIAERLRADALEFLRVASGVVPIAPFEGIELAGLVTVSKVSPFLLRLQGRSIVPPRRDPRLAIDIP